MYGRLWIVCTLAVAFAGRGASLQGQDQDEFPFGNQLQVLAQDLESSDYRDVLETMIFTDLAAEWKRVATPDIHVTFLRTHGGKQRVIQDPQLKVAYQKRLDVAERFLTLMREAYKQARRPPPFERLSEEELEKILIESSTRGSKDSLESVALRVIPPVAKSDQQWPRFRGPTGQGHAIETDFPLKWSASENVAWKSELIGRGHSSPVIWGDRLFVTSASEDGKQRLLLCYSRDQGDLLWKREAPAPDSVEKLYWKNSFASSTPVTDGELIVCFFGNSGMVCFDFDGKQVWHQPLGPFKTTHGPCANPVIYKDSVIFLQEQNRGEPVFVAFNKRTGEKLWQQKRPNSMCWASPVLVRAGNRDELIFNGSFDVVSFDPNTGNELWKVNGSSSEAIPQIVVGGGLIYSTSGRNGPTLAIRPGGNGDVTDSHVFWRTPRGGPHVPSPVYYDGHLYFVNDMGIASCLDAMTGDTLWQKRLKGRFSMSPVEVGGKLLMTNEDGRTFIVEAQPKFQLIAQNDLDEPVLATPAVLDGRIYFRTLKSLICIGATDTHR